ncbi:MAG: 2-oxoglutarate dehydrogenase E1 component, partial [Mariprofundaceae bacterium]|nr:2-oxoglutarate dehydrogenase E1 component [Mariprofundaceae bacterium]
MSQTLDDWLVAGGTWLENIYEQWQASPTSVSEAWQCFFEHEALDADVDSAHQAKLRILSQHSRLQQAGQSVQITGDNAVEYPSRAIYLIHAWRVYGHRQAQLDPLHLNAQTNIPELELNYYGLSEVDLDVAFPTGDMSGSDRLPLKDILKRLQQAYAGHIGPEVMHISNSAKKHWLFERLERLYDTAGYQKKDKYRIFKHVMHADAFEHYLHTRYMGQKR